MKPYELYNKDCREMAELPDESVQCVVTSPPYWGLRKYSGEQDLIWGGNENCEHEWVGAGDISDVRKTEVVAGKSRTEERFYGGDETRKFNGQHQKHYQDNTCSLCGAVKSAFGLENSPESYVSHTIEILREIRRVLRKDGVVFWNIGDSYGGTKQGNTESIKNPNVVTQDFVKSTKGTSIKPKDLCLIPFRVAIAAQEDGWWVRSDIIWAKPNPMPESCRDRPTNSHEYILMLTKSAKYYFDQEAVREKNTDPQRTNFVSGARTHGKNEDRNDNDLGERSKDFTANGRNLRSVWTFPTTPFPAAHFAVFPEALPERCIKAATPEVGCCSKCGSPWERVTEITDTRLTHGKNKVADDARGKHGRTSVFYSGEVPIIETIGWQPTCSCNELKYQSKYEENSTGLTPQGFHRTASIEKERTQSRIDAKRLFPNDLKAQKKYIREIHDHGGIKQISALGEQPTCQCNADKVPSIVLDPFAGAGTTLLSACKLNRHAVGYELSGEYCQMIEKRLLPYRYGLLL